MKHNLNPKVIATGLFNVADQSDDLDRVRDALRSLNHIVMDSGQFRVLIQSKKIKGKSKVEILNSVLEKLSHPNKQNPPYSSFHKRPTVDTTRSCFGS